MKENMRVQKEKKPFFSYNALRIIGLSLSILSIGLAIAVAGFILTQ